MKKFLIREYNSANILISLGELLSRLQIPNPIMWAFRDMEIRYPMPFGLDVQTFEKLTIDLTMGFVVSNSDFTNFLKTDFQIINGFIDIYSLDISGGPFVVIECFDTSYWEVIVNCDDFADELVRRGFRG